MGRLAALLGAIGAGWIFAHIAHISAIDQSSVYTYSIVAVLGFGLYASTRAIELQELRSQIGTVLVAVTIGVLAKVIMIAGVMFLLFHNSSALLFGIAVAQIDPLSVVAMLSRSRMSPSGKALLTAWASFDDPVTVLLTAYFAVLVRPGDSALATAGLGFGGALWNLALSLALAAVVFAGWRGFLALRRARTAAPSRALRVAGRVLAGLVVAGVAVLSVAGSLLLAVALIGLFFRPRLGRFVDIGTQVALYVGCVAMGLVLTGGAGLLPGLVLGVAAYGSQIVVGAALTVPRRWHGDRVRLALGQQNGLTAVILALLLEPAFPDAVTTIATAVVVTGVLNIACNGLWDRLRPPVSVPRAIDPAPDPAPVPALVPAVAHVVYVPPKATGKPASPAVGQ